MGDPPFFPWPSGQASIRSNVVSLRSVQQYYVDEDKPRWRKRRNLPPSSQKIISPYDTEARFSVRRSTKWEGYRVHLTETCDEDQPLLITNVETTTSASLDLQWTDTICPIEQHLALQKARKRQTTEEFKEVYARRAGVEGAISQGARVCGLRRPRYVGMAKTHLQHVFTAAAMNLVRLAAWYEETPRGRTRCSRFAALALAAYG